MLACYEHIKSIAPAAVEAATAAVAAAVPTTGTDVRTAPGFRTLTYFGDGEGEGEGESEDEKCTWMPFGTGATTGTKTFCYQINNYCFRQ